MTTPQRVSTGIKRLDHLLSGGVPRGSTTLIYGPPFTGKEVLTKRFFTDGLNQGTPGIMVLTDTSASETTEDLTRLDPAFPQHLSGGLAHFVDLYARSIGAEDNHPATEYVDGPMNLNAVNLAVNNIQRKLVPDYEQHRIVIRSLSTLIVYSNPQTVFRFLQIFLGKSKRAGATTMLMLQAGMHTDSEVQMFKHLCNGVIETKEDGGKHLLHVSGLDLAENPGWVEYAYTPTSFEITGSFATGRIR